MEKEEQRENQGWGIAEYRVLTIVLGCVCLLLSAAIIALLGLAKGLLQEWAPELASCAFGIMPIGCLITIAAFAAISLSCASTGYSLFSIDGKARVDEKSKTLDLVEAALPSLGVILALIGLTGAFGEITDLKAFLLLSPGLASLPIRSIRLALPCFKDREKDKSSIALAYVFLSFLFAILPGAIALGFGIHYAMFLYLLLPLSYLVLVVKDEIKDKGSDI